MIERPQEFDHLPVEVVDHDKCATVNRRAIKLFAGDRLASKDVYQMVRKLATLLGAGPPLGQSLSILVKPAESKRQRKCLTIMLDQLRCSADLADALAAAGPVFSGFHLGMIRAGESGRLLAVALARLAEDLARAPALQLSTKRLLLSGDAVERWWWVLLVTVAAVGFGLRRLLRGADFAAYWHRWLLHQPVAREVVAKAEVVRFAHTVTNAAIRTGRKVAPRLPTRPEELETQRRCRWIEQSVVVVGACDLIAVCLRKALKGFIVKTLGQAVWAVMTILPSTEPKWRQEAT